MGRQTRTPTAILPWNLSAAINEIEREDGVTVDIVGKAKALSKFGRNSEIGTALETVWQLGGDEVYSTTNDVDSVSSSDATDTQTLTIEGHTIDADNNLTFVVQQVILSGQTRVALTTPLARVNRVANVSSDDLAGDVYVYENGPITAGVPNDLTTAHASVLGTLGQNQTFKAATSVSSSDYFILTRLQLSVTRKTAATVDGILERRVIPNVFRPVTGIVTVNSSGQSTVSIELNPALIVRPNSDIRFRAIASSTGTEVSATFAGYFAQISY